ncbi:glucose-6-phosphate 1-dehydrogenase [Pedobacter westerhofensis]|uniref:Glucose-6-phosphate 1-dehydrogenase n=1 Tax=Pedobacter westerhofensis TaxID=425512 RepID=A0A521DTM2_9SPHI|nr:glucose-6-phosphate dehydrogenase [Pedobacter westerhofensis]SMO75079.1 glucose-6-phosphate 1-dehydrogenase [Pedobacter westerhofensis]
MEKRKRTVPAVIVIFGGTGDLAKRKLIPALYNLYLDGRMPQNFQIIGLGRTDLENSAYREKLFNDLSVFSRSGVPSLEEWEGFACRLYYFRSSIESFDSYSGLEEKIEAAEIGFGERSDRIFYLSVAPRFIAKVTENIKLAGLADGLDHDRIIIEKPFGHTKTSAVELNELLTSSFSEKQIYRIDHYLGKETVQNILSLRFANALFEPLWNAEYIESVDITVAEKIGVEGRGSYFEAAGALKDMIQNHLLQILSMVAMESPDIIEAEHIRDRKVELLKAIRRIPVEEVREFVVRGRYGSGTIDGKDVVGYLEEDGVHQDSITETYVALNFFIDNPRWAGVPFFLRTGKRLLEKSSSVKVNFRNQAEGPFRDIYGGDQLPNRLLINLQPGTDIRLRLNAKKPGVNTGLRTAEMIFDFGADNQYSPEAYETLISDMLAGDPSLFMRADQVNEAWDVIMPVLDAWSQGSDDLLVYTAGIAPEELIIPHTYRTDIDELTSRCLQIT